MGTSISTAINGARHAPSAPIPMDATTTAIITVVNEHHLAHLLPPLLAGIHGEVAEDHKDYDWPLSLVDLDCDTGQNTLTLATLTRHWRRPVQLEGWDRDKGKLESAEARCKDATWDNMNSSVTFNYLNLWKGLQMRLPVSPYFRHMYGFVLGVLIMHRLPLDILFKGIGGLLERDGVAVITWMHPDIGVTEASSTESADEKSETNEEADFRHSVEGVLETAARYDLTLQGAVQQVRFSSEMVERLEHDLRENAMKWVGRDFLISVVLKRVIDHAGP